MQNRNFINLLVAYGHGISFDDMEERLRWIRDTNVLLSKFQTPEEKERARIIKHKCAR